jgi:hypothetical protein
MVRKSISELLSCSLHTFAELENVNFHRSSFQNRAFLSIDLTADWLHQVVPGGILQIQPRLGL